MSDADSIDRGWGAAALDGTTLKAGVWQVNTRGRKVVAMTEPELAASFKAGKLTARSLVWSDGMSEWTPLGDVPQLAKLLRESVPPESGTRPRLDEITSGTEAYGAGGEVTTNTGGLAVYERPLALIEFPENVEPAEPADEPTPAFLTPTATPVAKAKTAASAPLPKVAPREPQPEAKSAPKAAPAPVSKPAPTSKVVRVEDTPEPSTVPAKAAISAPEAAPPAPPLPPLPSIRATLPGPLFPEPVLASPLAAALSSTAASQRPSTPVPRIPTPLPAPPPLASAFATKSAPTLPNAAVASAEAQALVKPPRPAIEFLPPIIVHEKEDDDGASAILELPLHPSSLMEAPFSESTLVLSGRKRARRWIPLNAALALCVGAACLAASLTALVVRSRPTPPPRVVEKIVTVPAPVAPPPPITVATSEPAPAPVVTAEARVKASPAETTAAATGSEPTDRKPEGGKSEATKTDAAKGGASEAATPAPRREAARPDPSGLVDDVKPRREARAGFPTSPGF